MGGQVTGGSDLSSQWQNLRGRYNPDAAPTSGVPPVALSPNNINRPTGDVFFGGTPLEGSAPRGLPPELLNWIRQQGRRQQLPFNYGGTPYGGGRRQMY
jgi:hypothetical protein